MAIDEIIKQLEEERNRIDRAIQILAGVRSGTVSNRTATKPISRATRSKIVGKGRTMSAASRRKIAAAQRARWAKVRIGKK